MNDLPSNKELCHSSSCEDILKSVYWNHEGDTVRMINQQVLPHKMEILECKNVADVARSIKDMNVRGAPAIGAVAAKGVALGALQSSADTISVLIHELREHKNTLDATRPTAVNLTWATKQMLDLAEALLEHDAEMPAYIASKALLDHSLELASDDISVNRRLAKFGAELVPEGSNIMHHCNTGSLATVGYGTALGVIFQCHEQRKNIHVWVNETRPRLQGARLTAWELQRAGVPMHLVADSAAGHLISSGKVDVIVFGADRVAHNGDVANKIGSYALSVLARESGVPVYACVPTSTIDLETETGADIEIEERHADEVRCVRGVHIAPIECPVYNPAFDVTPYRFLTGIITEEGVCYPPYRKSLAEAKLKASLRKRQIKTEDILEMVAKHKQQ